ncbi:MAG: hypothetical protein ACLP4V_19240, partial [Methylocella sp.]
QAAKPSMRASNRRVLDASARIDSPKDRKAKMQCQTILKCDSPDEEPQVGIWPVTSMLGYLFGTLFWTSGLESVLKHIPR